MWLYIPQPDIKNSSIRLPPNNPPEHHIIQSHNSVAYFDLHKPLKGHTDQVYYAFWGYPIHLSYFENHDHNPKAIEQYKTSDRLSHLS